MRRRAVELEQAGVGGLALGSDLLQSCPLRSGYMILDPEMAHDRNHRGLQLTHAVSSLVIRSSSVIGGPPSSLGLVLCTVGFAQRPDRRASASA